MAQWLFNCNLITQLQSNYSIAKCNSVSPQAFASKHFVVHFHWNELQRNPLSSSTSLRFVPFSTFLNLKSHSKGCNSALKHYKLDQLGKQSEILCWICWCWYYSVKARYVQIGPNGNRNVCIFRATLLYLYCCEMSRILYRRSQTFSPCGALLSKFYIMFDMIYSVLCSHYHSNLCWVLKWKMKKWGRPKQEQNAGRSMGHWIADEVKMTTDRGFFK